MKRILFVLSAMGVIAFGGPAAVAADLAVPLYAPPPPQPVYSWTGFYVGANGGFGGDKFQFPFSVGPITGTSTLTAPAAGPMATPRARPTPGRSVCRPRHRRAKPTTAGPPAAVSNTPFPVAVGQDRIFVPQSRYRHPHQRHGCRCTVLA